MKFAKLSLAAVAAMGITSGAMALDLSKASIKPYVNTKFYYETIDANKQKDGDNYDKLFNKNSSEGQALLQVGATGKLNGCWGYGLEYSIADTLGLENQVVRNTRMGNGEKAWATDQNASVTDTQDWVSQAYVTFRGCGTPLKNTTFKIGRQYLDTPLAFTENWNLAPNSFDAIVAVNTDIQNVTLVGAYVGKGNGAFATVTNGERFKSYVKEGAWAAGILTNFGLPVNIWAYDVLDIAKAYWVDTNYKFANDGVNYMLGAQYSTLDPKATGATTTRGGAVKIGATFGDYAVSAAYSKVNDGGALAIANTATLNGNSIGKKTKLYTAGIYTDGSGVAIPGSKAYKIAASAKTSIGKFSLAYVDCKNTDTGASANVNANTALTNVKETDLVYATKVLGINTKLILINRNINESKGGATASFPSANLANVLNQDTKHVRLVLSKKF